jgi:hypothetical protein
VMIRVMLNYTPVTYCVIDSYNESLMSVPIIVPLPLATVHTMP